MKITATLAYSVLKDAGTIHNDVAYQSVREIIKHLYICLSQI